jgi:hypothetical protein
MRSFGKEVSRLMYHEMMDLKSDDPLLCIKWNENWHHPNGLNPIIDFIRDHGGEDPQGSGFMFHFLTFDKLARCQTLLKKQFPHAFHESDLMRQRLAGMNIIMNQPIKIGDAWIITNVDGEHCFQENFFEA